MGAADSMVGCAAQRNVCGFGGWEEEFTPLHQALGLFDLETIKSISRFGVDEAVRSRCFWVVHNRPLLDLELAV